MRAPRSGILAAAITFAAVPAAAQTYAPGYPVCLQAYTIDGEHIECSYATMAQCRVAASGRGATCLANPNSGGPSPRPAGASRRPARASG